MEFVTYVLERFFNKSRESAVRIMLHVHQNGVGVCGVFTYEVAETKVAQVIESGPPPSAPAPVHHGKGLRGPTCHRFRAILKSPFIGPSLTPTQRKHEYATLEHLLLSLIDDTDAAARHARL